MSHVQFSLSRYFSGLLLLPLLIVHPVFASNDLSEEDFFAESQSLSTATRMKQSQKNVPASISIIDRQMIEASSALSVVELLRLVPGFQTAWVDGTEATTTYHGFSDQHARRLQVLIDGRSVYTQVFGGPIWHTLLITLDEIERIEVIRGPNAAAYGANSFSAIINIITRTADSSPGTKAKLTFGDRDTQMTEISHSEVINNKLSYRVDLGYNDNDGFPGKFDDHLDQQFNSRIDYVSESGNLNTLQAGFKFITYGIGDPTSTDDPARTKKVRSSYQNYIWEDSQDIFSTTRFQIYHNHFSQSDFIRNQALPLTLDLNLKSDRYDLEIQQNHLLSPDIQTVFGGGIRYDTVVADGLIEDGLQDRYQIRLFAQTEIKQNEQLIWNLGLMSEHHQDVGTYHSPRVALNWHVDPRHTLRSSWTKAYRMPSFFDRQAYMTIDTLTGSVFSVFRKGNHSLRPERMEAFEIGYLGYFLDNKLDVDIKISSEKILNVLDSGRYITTPEVWNHLNFGWIKLKTFEFQANYRPDMKTLLRMAFSHVDAEALELKSSGTANPVANSTGTDNRAPNRTWSLLFSKAFEDQWWFSSQFTYVDPMTWGGEGDAVEAFERVDVKIRKGFSIGGNNIELSWLIRNLLNHTAQEFVNNNIDSYDSFIQLKMGLY